MRTFFLKLRLFFLLLIESSVPSCFATDRSSKITTHGWVINFSGRSFAWHLAIFRLFNTLHFFQKMNDCCLRMTNLFPKEIPKLCQVEVFQRMFIILENFYQNSLILNELVKSDSIKNYLSKIEHMWIVWWKNLSK